MKSDIRLSYCDNCIHNNICGIKDELSKLLDTCNKLSTNNKVDIIIVDDYDYVKLINYAIKKEPENVHAVSALYLKKIDAEK